MKAKLSPAIVCILMLAVPLASAFGQGAAADTKGAQADLAALAKSWSANWSFDALSGNGYIVRGQDLVRFRLGYPAYLTGGSTLISAAAPVWNASRVELPADAIQALQRWFDERDADRASKATVVAILIDPGHGGKDPGALGEYGSGANKFRIAEKDLVLRIAKDLHKRLSQLWPDKQILITREGDSYPSLDERVEMANKAELSVNQAIIYISIHANASFNKNASGYEVWYLNPEYRRTVVDAKKAEGVDKDVLPILNAMLEEEYTTESVFLARSILDGISSSLGPATTNRGLRAEEWFVVRNARMPSVLVEVGFVTNEAEARLLADEGHLRKLGDGIYNGVLSFVDYFERRRSASAP